MALQWSKELLVVVEEARDVAERLDQPLTTAHLLLCLFTLRNRASAFLSDHRVTADRLLEALDGRVAEKDGLWDRAMRRAEEVALAAGARQVTSLHVLVALCSFVECSAYRLMARLNLDLGTIRSTALSYLMTSAEQRDASPEPQPVAVPAGHPGHAVGRTAARIEASRAHDPGPAADDDPPEPDRRARAPREPDDVRRRRRRSGTRERTPPSPPPSSLAQRVHGPRRSSPIVPRTDVPLPPTVARSGGRPVPQPAAPPAAPATPRSAAPLPDAAPPRSRFVLREKDFPVLSRFGRNLSLLACDGQLDAVLGRDRELDQLVDILGKRRANNPVIVGDPGVGKTAIVEGLALLVSGRIGPPPPGLEGRIIVELEASRMLGGTGVRGAFAERLQKLKAEVAQAEGRIVVFLDELHHWIGMGAGGDGNTDGAGELKTALARGEFPCIGATTFDEYRKFIEADPAFERRFQQVRVLEPTPDEAVRILTGIRPRYESHHDVTFEPESIDAAVRLSYRYIPERRLPDKAIGILDLAGSRARRIGAQSVGRPLIATIVAEQTGLSPEKLLMADRERFLNLEERLMQRIVGHQTVIERVAHVLRRNYAGFVSGRPIGSFLFLGPTGVGKTEFARALASVLFDNDQAIVRIDMSEYLESHAISRLIGAPPGYLGHDAGGQLTDAIRRTPYQIVLLDEIEKAHPDVLNLLLQILDDGRLTDARGRTVDFSNTIVIMTSNLGADAGEQDPGPSRRVGFVTQAQRHEPRNAPDQPSAHILNAARRHFRPEIWNRIDEPLVFPPLARDEIARIARLQLTRSSERLLAERQVAFSFAPEVIPYLLDHGGYDPTLGARPMRRTIERLVEARIAEKLLSGTVTPPAELEVLVRDGQIVVENLVPGDGEAEHNGEPT